MTDELRGLINELSRKLIAEGFEMLPNGYHYQASFVEPGAELSYKDGKTIQIDVCGTHNEKVEPVSVYVRSLRWKNSSTVGKECLNVRISWKFSAKKRDTLLSEVIAHFRAMPIN